MAALECTKRPCFSVLRAESIDGNECAVRTAESR